MQDVLGAQKNLKQKIVLFLVFVFLIGSYFLQYNIAFARVVL